MTILNAAVVGPGGRARVHLPIIRLLPDKYRLVAGATLMKSVQKLFLPRLELVDTQIWRRCWIRKNSSSDLSVGTELAIGKQPSLSSGNSGNCGSRMLSA